MGTVKQVLLVRTNYPDNKGGQRKIRSGKLAAQVAHASMKVFFDRQVLGFNSTINERLAPQDFGRSNLVIPLTAEMDQWVNGTFTKIVLGVDSEADLLLVYQSALDAGLPAAIIQDMGATEFHGVPTYTTCAIGPDLAEKIDLITGPNGVVKTKLL